MKKKPLSLVLALVMVLGLLPATALAADKVEINWLPGGIEPLGYIEESDRVLARNGQVWYLLTTSGTIDKVLGNLGSSIDISGYYGSMTFASGMQSVAVDGKGAFIDGTGKVVLQTEYEDVYNFSKGMAQVTSGGLYGFIDETGKTVVPLGYNEAKEFSEGLAAVRIGDWDTGKCGFIDKTGKIVIPLEYEYAESFSEGLACVKKNGKYGYINYNGETVIPFQYEEAGPFSEGLAEIVEYGGGSAGLSSYYIDKTGTVVIPKRDRGSVGWGLSFSGGLAPVYLENGYGYMDKAGKVVIPEVPNMGLPGEVQNGLICYECFDEAYNSWFECIDKTGAKLFEDRHELIVVDGPCGYVMDNDRWGIFINPYYTPSQPEQPTEPAGTATANPTNDKLTSDGELQNPTVYKIGDSNYFKIRDLAAILNGTEKQFSVGYDNEKKSVTATTGQGYTKLDGDLAGAPAGAETAELSNDTIYVNGQKVEAEVYKIGGMNYFKLRDLGKALNFYVGYDSQTGIFIDTSKPYSE